MASGRFLSVSIAEDDKLSRLSMQAEFIYLKTIPHLDCDGMISGKPGFLWAKVCPLREELFGKTQSIIDEWVELGLVIKFDTDEGPALFFPGFLKNNKLPHYDRERDSRFPAPPGYTRTKSGLIIEGAEIPVKKQKKTESDSNSDKVLDQVQDKVQDQVQEKELQEQEQEQDKDKDKDKDKEGGIRNVNHADTIQPPNPPLSFRPEHKHATSYIEEAKALGIGPEPFRLMVDEVLDATGKRHKADAERNDLTLNQAKDTVIQVAKMGYVCIEDIQRILHSWTKNDWRGDTAPTFGQVVDHASAMIDGKHITRKQTAQAGVDAEKAAIKETSKRIQMEALRTAQKFNAVVQELADDTPPF